jgi:uncharacterized membrane protein
MPAWFATAWRIAMNDSLTNPQPNANDAASLDSARTLTFVIYVLYAAGFLTGGLTSIAGLIIAYVKRDSVAGTYLASHFTWAIRTFWLSLGLGVLAVLLMFFGIGFLLMMALGVWVIYRIVVGALAVNDRKAIAEGKWGLAA